MLLHATARPEKEWPVANWIALAQSLAARGYAPVLPWGNETERQRSMQIAAAVPNARVPDLQPLDQVARMIARATCVVGVDTGLLHVAAALGVPLAAIFIGTEPGQHGPLGGGKDRDRRVARRHADNRGSQRGRGPDRPLGDARRCRACAARSPNVLGGDIRMQR